MFKICFAVLIGLFVLGSVVTTLTELEIRYAQEDRI